MDIWNRLMGVREEGVGGVGQKVRELAKEHICIARRQKVW